MRDPVADSESLLQTGDRLRDAGQLAEAETCYQRYIETEPASPEGYFKLGAMHGRAGRKAEAEQCYRQALLRQQAHPGALNNLALLQFSEARFGEAENLYRLILANQIDYFEAHINLGNVLNNTGRAHEALYHFRRACELRSDSALAHERTGAVLRNFGRVIDAIECIERSLRIDARSPVAWNNLGACHFVRGEHAAAYRAFAESLKLDEDQDAAWNNLAFLSNLMTLDRAEGFALHCSFGRWLRQRSGVPDGAPLDRTPDPARKLRIGFVSGDFRHHSVAYFLRGFLPQLDRLKVETWAYSNSRIVDAITDQLRGQFLRWRDIVDLADQAAAEVIRADRIDILIDLAGHTSTNRLGVFARRAAPVQVSWIGYPATTGLDSIDYRLTDAIADPEEDDDRYHTESLWRLPGPFLCFNPPDDAPPVADVPCLAGAPLTFGSFNARVKIGEECAALWARVLLAVPDSRLLVKCINGVEELESREQLVAEFVRHGVAAGRIEVLSSVPSTAGHLAHYHRIDVALDSFPYHGTTTTCEALWMGVPVVTLAGDRHASRVGVSLLTHLQLDELIARSADEFVSIAKELAYSPRRLDEYRRGLRGRLSQSPLLDAESMARRFEAATRGMWGRQCATVKPELQDVADSAASHVARMKLHIGGRQVRDGWKILNAQPGEGVDYVGDIRSLESLDDECCEDVYASHILEHLPIDQVIPALKGVHRILAPDGRLMIAVPDLDVLGALFQRTDIDFPQRIMLLRMIYGSQSDSFDYHYVGFNFDVLAGCLAAAGFTGIEQVASFGLFNDCSEIEYLGARISLNVVVTK